MGNCSFWFSVLRTWCVENAPVSTGYPGKPLRPGTTRARRGRARQTAENEIPEAARGQRPLTRVVHLPAVVSARLSRASADHRRVRSAVVGNARHHGSRRTALRSLARCPASLGPLRSDRSGLHDGAGRLSLFSGAPIAQARSCRDVSVLQTLVFKHGRAYQASAPSFIAEQGVNVVTIPIARDQHALSLELAVKRSLADCATSI